MSCLVVSGSRLLDPSFIHNKAPLYSVLACSMRFTVVAVSSIARLRNVSTSLYSLIRGVRRANLCKHGGGGNVGVGMRGIGYCSDGQLLIKS